MPTLACRARLQANTGHRKETMKAHSTNLKFLAARRYHRSLFGENDFVDEAGFDASAIWFSYDTA